MTAVALPSLDNAGQADVRRARALVPVVLGAAVIGGVVAAKLAGQGHPMMIFLFALVPLPFALWKWPQLAVILALAGTVVVEQFEYTVGARKGVWTESIPLFHSLSKGAGVSPLEIFLVVVFLIWLMKGALTHSLAMPRSPLWRSITIFLVLVTVVGLGIGLTHGGKVKISLWEARPWFYLAALYVLTASILKTRKALRALLWTLVLGSGFKSILGVMIFLAVRHQHPRPEATLAHEEAFFFGLFIILTLGLWIFQIRGRLRFTATAFLPLVILANLGNSRRNSWAILALGTIMLLVIAYKSLPHRRPMLRRLTAVILLLSAVYFPVYWNHNGTLAQPARALHSTVAPSARDLQSNQYREAEDSNLILNIQQSKSLGRGFGIPITYGFAIIDLRSADSAIAFVPHNGILYIWMRLGIVGEMVFLFMIATALIRACQLAKLADREMALLGAFVACSVVAYLVQGYNDMGFFWFRIALCMGVLLGAMEAALRMAREPKAVEAAVR